jgi:hypothetical protein
MNLNQHTMALRFHQGPYLQRGGGLGNIFGSLFKAIIPAASKLGRNIIKSPLTKSILKSAKDTAVEGGLTLASDALRGRDMGESVQKNLKRARSRVADAIESGIAPPPKKKGRRKRQVTPPSSDAEDLFDD